MSAHWSVLLLAVCVLTVCQRSSAAGVPVVNLLRTFIVNNVAGSDQVHEVRKYEFDPEVADRRRLEFEARNGVMGRDLVERLGLGEDGRMAERKQQQRTRDRAAGYFFQD